jgi:hypothetical protein
MNSSIDIPQRTGQEEVLHSSIEAHAKSSTIQLFQLPGERKTFMGSTT